MNARSASLVAQAKVNLILRILAREATGYHQIETLFCRLALGDVVRVRVESAGRTLDCSGPMVPDAGLGPTERNLAWRAAVAFADAVGWPTGFAIEVEKRIPVGGGLGGGSADAGAVLRALNALAPRPLSAGRLVELAGTLGADVPFLTQVDSTLALGWGRGDRLLALPPLPARSCTLFVASFGVSSGDAYRWYAETAPAAPPAAVLAASALSEWGAVDQLSANAFEDVVFDHVPALAEAHLSLARQARGAGLSVLRMSGSGATLFALGSGEGASVTPLDPPSRFATVVTQTATAVAPVELSD